MQAEKVKDIMVPLEEYAVVPENFTVAQAVEVLHEAQKAFDQDHYKHRGVLVSQAGTGAIIGKISQWALLQGLEPKYECILDPSRRGPFAYNPEFAKHVFESQRLFAANLTQVSQQLAKAKVTEIMQTLQNEEVVDEGDSLEQAIHIFVLGHHQSLLVKRGQMVVGILRVSDVFKEVCERILLGG